MRLTAALAFSTLLFAVSCGTTTEQCGPDNCGGCCSAEGKCEPGNTASLCGERGAICSACSGNDVCEAHACAAPHCDASNCDGCCTADGLCHTGDIDTQCGSGGASCAACDTGKTCQQNACATYVPPITATAETWTWVPFPESECGNGTATGIGVNLTSRSTDVVLYLEPGGACWDAYSCGPLHAATNLSGYGATEFGQDTLKNGPPFSRSTATNPFKDMSFVYVPYCTGDVHAGDAVTTYPASGNAPTITVHHRGAANMRAYLTRLAATFPNATRVFVTGSSAGAYGAQFNFPAVKAAFPNAEVHSLADCGQMVNPVGTLSTWVSAWGLQVPASCTDCSTDFTKFPAWLAATYPQSRFGLLAYTQDSTLSFFFGYASGADFETQTRALLAADYDPTSNAKYYLDANTEHVMLDDLNTLTNNGVTLLDWTTAFVTGTGWASVSP